MEEWRSLTFLGYDHYEISDHGRVRNTDTGRIIRVHPNNHNIYHVGLYSEGVRTNYSVGKLVALAFLPKPESEYFDTVTHRNGKKYDNYYGNLEWRPHWFSVKYNQEYNAMNSYPETPVVETTTNLWFKRVRDAASYFCLLEEDVHKACLGGPAPIFGRDLRFEYESED